MRTLAGMVKGRSQGQAGANTETQPATVTKIYADAVGNVYAADVRGDGLAYRILQKCQNASGIRLWPGANVLIAWTRGSRFAPSIISTGSAESGSVLSSAQIGQDSLNNLNGDGENSPDLSGVGFLLAGPDETVPDAYVLNPGANVYFEDTPSEQTSGGYQNAQRVITSRPLVLSSLPDGSSLADATCVDLIDSYGGAAGLFRWDKAAGVWRQRDTSNTEVIAARTRDMIGRFAANTFATLKAHLAAIWDTLNLCTADPTGVTEGFVLTVNGSGGVEFAAPSGGEWLGAWSSATAYNVGEEVGYQGSSWICILAHTNHAPPTLPTESNTWWELRAKKGDQGNTGSTGANGTDGATWRTGSGVPSNALGVNNDLYIDTATGTYYKRVAGSYVSQGSLLGPAGTNGANGADLLPRGAWNSGSSYSIRDYVYYSGFVYVAVAASTNVTPGTDPTKWMLGGSNGLDGRGYEDTGNWNSGTAYAVDDLVQYQGSTYRCKVANTNVIPTSDLTKWAVWAQKGADGSSGSANPRDTVSIVTDAIANNAYDRTKKVALGKGTPVYKVEVSDPCVVILYATQAHRDADVSRNDEDDPIGDHGILGDWRFPAGTLTWRCGPIPFVANLEDTPDGDLWTAVKNESGSSGAITVTFTRSTVEP